MWPLSLLRSSVASKCEEEEEGEGEGEGERERVEEGERERVEEGERERVEEEELLGLSLEEELVGSAWLSTGSGVLEGPSGDSRGIKICVIMR